MTTVIEKSIGAALIALTLIGSGYPMAAKAMGPAPQSVDINAGITVRFAGLDLSSRRASRHSMNASAGPRAISAAPAVLTGTEGCRSRRGVSQGQSRKRLPASTGRYSLHCTLGI